MRPAACFLLGMAAVAIPSERRTRASNRDNAFGKSRCGAGDQPRFIAVSTRRVSCKRRDGHSGRENPDNPQKKTLGRNRAG
jgi:hypothetical protein